MKIIFFGTADLAGPALNALTESKHEILGVVTAPDRKKGRGQKIKLATIKTLAQKKGLAIFQPESLQDAKFIQGLRNKSADLFVVCAFGKIFTKDILQIPRICAINLHASLLPKYRGAAPISWTIINGEKQTGVTVFKMNEYMDRGAMILQKKINISSSETALSLTETLSKLGTSALLEAIDLLERGKVTFVAQDDSQASLAPKLRKQDGLIDWRSPAIEIYNRIKGLQPWPGAFTFLDNKLLKIWQSEIVESAEKKKPGEIVTIDAQGGILVQTGKDQLLIQVLQLEGKRKMAAQEFILGHKVELGKILGK